jgi:ATP-dependent Clp protease protease subunit
VSLHVIYFMTALNHATSAVFRKQCLEAINNQGATELIVHISSQGGSLHEAFTLYQFLKSLPVKVTTTNAGAVESAAVMFYLGGHHRTVSPAARFVFHPWTWTFGEGGHFVHVIREALHSLETDMDRFVEMFDKGTAGAAQPFDLRSSFHAAKTVNAGDAIKHGIADEVKESTTPLGAVIWWVNPAQ